LVFRLCDTIVGVRGAELTSIQYALSTSAPHIVNIALTLQRLGGEYRSKGLDLFERLLLLGVDDAQIAMKEVDKRLESIVRQAIPPRRTRRKNH
jgi:hypothetical protein